jgi:hypothetical protein
MEVTYTTTPEDYAVYCMHCNAKSKTSFHYYMVNWLLWPIAALVVAGYGHYFGEWRAITIATIILAAAVMLVFYPLYYRLYLKGYIQTQMKELGGKGIIGTITLIANEDTLTEITETTRSEVRWKDIHRLDEVGDYTFIFVTPLNAAILPKHAFSSPSQYQEITSYARERLGRSKTPQ